MPSRSRQLLTRTTVVLGDGTPVEARQAEVEAALRTLPGKPELSLRLKRSIGELAFTYLDGKYEVASEGADGICFEPIRVTLDKALDIARIFVKLGMLHEGHRWRERG